MRRGSLVKENFKLYFFPLQLQYFMIQNDRLVEKRNSDVQVNNSNPL